MKEKKSRKRPIAWTIGPIVGLMAFLSLGSPWAVAASAPSSVLSPGGQVEVIGSSVHEDLLEAVHRQVPPWRDQLFEAVRKSNLPAALADAASKKDVVGTLQGMLGIPSNREILVRYDAALRACPPDKLLRTFDVHRVYVYDKTDAIKRIKAGEEIPHMSYDPKTDQLNFAPSVTMDTDTANTDAPTSVDVTFDGKHEAVPIAIIAVEPYSSGDEIVSKQLGEYLQGYETLFLKENAIAGFSIVNSIVGPLLSAQLPKTPAWCSQGLQEFMDMALLSRVVDSKQAYQYMVIEKFTRVDKPDAKALVPLAEWDPVTNFEYNGYYQVAAMTVFSKINSLTANKTWCADLIAHLKTAGMGLPKGQAPSSDDVYRAISSVADVDAKPLMR